MKLTGKWCIPPIQRHEIYTPLSRRATHSILLNLQNCTHQNLHWSSHSYQSWQSSTHRIFTSTSFDYVPEGISELPCRLIHSRGEGDRREFEKRLQSLWHLHGSFTTDLDAKHEKQNESENCGGNHCHPDYGGWHTRLLQYLVHHHVVRLLIERALQRSQCLHDMYPSW